MIIQLIGSGTELENLETLVNKALNDLALSDAISIKTSNDEALKMELGITQILLSQSRKKALIFAI